MIFLNPVVFRKDSSKLDTAAEGLKAMEAVKPDISANSEPLKNYIECLEEIQELMELYGALLKTDSLRIQSSVDEMIKSEKHLFR